MPDTDIRYHYRSDTNSNIAFVVYNFIQCHATVTIMIMIRDMVRVTAANSNFMTDPINPNPTDPSQHTDSLCMWATSDGGLYSCL